MTQGTLRIAWAAAILAAAVASSASAQTPAINTLKGKIFDAKMAQQTFANGLHHCSELNGSNFYFQQRDRVLNLDDYHHSLDNLVMQRVFNPDTKQPWGEQDAEKRWQQVKAQAAKDQETCALVTSLPDLQKQLDAMQQTAASQSQTPPATK
ncbi:MAG TPA: hypothetical protein VH206_12435 [Xanthobacteraceae bacterium]|nr:hypothetical protein [Xanthobacteraceae bacterium]